MKRASVGSATQPSATTFVRRVAVAVLALLVLHLILVLPTEAHALRWTALFRVPAELFAVLLTLSVARGSESRVVRGVLTVILTAILIVKLADIGASIAFGRPFDLILDFHLLRSGAELATGTLGAAGALLAFLALDILITAIVALLWFSLQAAGEAILSGGARLRLVLAGLLALSLFGAAAGFDGITFNTTTALTGQIERARVSFHDLARFRDEAANDPTARLPPNSLFAALRGRDVLFVFVESYGANLLSEPDYRPRTEAALARFDLAIARQGLSARSAFLTSTTMGGQSWLAHSSLLSGLRIDNQRRYDALLNGTHGTLISDFRRAGWRALAVMPAIVRDWPESGFYGFDRIYAAKDLGYRGKPFDWVTMPDQFTLSAFERLKQAEPGAQPIIAEIALISSHFPWAPLPDLVDWDEIGDGRVFDAQVAAGEPPDSIWRDPERVRGNYLASIEYVLGTVASYIQRFGNERLVTILVGDHPPIPWIAGEQAGRQVPVHLIGAPAVLAELGDWNWTQGMTPGKDAPVWPMEAFRGRFVRAFSAKTEH